MEHTSGPSAFSGAGRKLNSYLPPGCLQGRPSAFSQKVIMIWFVFFTTHAARQVLAATRNETYIQGLINKGPVLPVWDKAEYREKLKCKAFHDKHDRISEKFFYWPEDNPLFRYCCSTNSQEKNSSQRFRYSKYGEALIYAKYRDVGYFDQCLPFWRCRKTYHDILHTQIYVAYCEKTDLEKLYWQRFWRLIVWKYSFLQMILPWIPILEAAVVSLALIMFPWTWRLAGKNLARTFGWKDVVPTGKIWLKSTWKRVLMDWGHMYLLAMMGNGLFEAMRRQSAYSMQSKLFFAYSTLYLMLFLILSGTSVMQQLAYWIGSATEPKVIKYWKENQQSPPDKEADNVIPKDLESDRAGENDPVKKRKVSVATSDEPLYGHDAIELTQVVTDVVNVHGEDRVNSQAETDIIDDEQCILEEGTRHDHTIVSTQSNALARLMSCFCFKKRSASVKLRLNGIKGSFRKHLSVEEFKLGDDYKWQPIATQATILFALGSLLTISIDNDDDSTELFAMLLGYLVQAGCLWSGMYSVVVFFQRAAYILKFLMKLLNTDDLQPSGNRSVTRYLEFEGLYQIHTTCPVRIREATAWQN